MNTREMPGQMSIFDLLSPDTVSMRMLPEPLAATKERTSGASLKKQRKSQTKTPQFLDLRTGNGNLAGASWVTDIQSLGACMTANITAFRNAESAYVYLLTSTGTQHQEYYLNCSEKPLTEKPSKLSDILELNPDPKYQLSAKACQGILRRAEKRGKKLPPLLEKTLKRQSGGGLYDVRISSDGTRNWRAHCYETDISRNLDTGGMNPDSNHGGVAIVENSKQAYGVVTKGNGDAFINQDTHTSLTNGGGQAGQGYPCVLEDKCLNPWDVQSKHIQPENGTAESLYSGECRYGGGESYVMCLNDQGGSQMDISKDVTGTLRSQEHGHQPIVYGISGYESNAMKSSNPHSGIYEAETTRTLDNNGGNPACNQGGMMVVQSQEPINAICVGNGQLNQISMENVANALDTMHDQQAIITYDSKLMDAYQHHGYRESDTCGTLTAEQNQTVRGDTPLIVEDKPVTVNNSSYGGYEESEISGSLKASGGDRGGQRIISDTVGSLCARDFKGVGNQYVNEGKCVIQLNNRNDSEN